MRNKSLILLTAALSMALFGCPPKNETPSGTSGTATGGDILIGEYGSLTGAQATFGQSTHNGIMMAADEVNGAAVYGFVFDFCGVEIDRDTGTVCVDKYVSLHDAGRILNPAPLDGQVRGGFAMAVGAALYERLVYAEDGGCVTGSRLPRSAPEGRRLIARVARPWYDHVRSVQPRRGERDRELATPLTPLRGFPNLSRPYPPGADAPG